MRNTNTLPFYFRGWFFAILIVAAIPTFLLSLIPLIVLFIFRNKKYPNLSLEQQVKWNEIIASENTAQDIVNNSKEQGEKIIQTATTKANEINKQIEESQNQLNQLNDEVKKLQSDRDEMIKIVEDKADEVLLYETTVEFTDNITSNEIKNELSLIQLNEKDLIKSGVAINSLGTKTKTEIAKQSKQLLRAFNAEADYYTSNVTVKNVDTYRNKLAKAFETLNKLFEVDGVKISQPLLTSKLKQLDLLYKYQKQIEIEKELLKAQKDEIREQQKVEKEIQDAKRKLEKEEQQFNNEMSKLLKYLNSANNTVEQQIYADKIKELEEKIKLLEKDKQNVLDRESNTRAGYVYIISNIGSFGENVYKIGMTRRLEPMDRINELSSASVPFPFDVHALIFSEDAPALENTLHNYFRDKEVNKVNPRKEFFKVDLQEIKELVHKEYNNTVHFTDLAVAEQYYESLKFTND